MYTNPQPTTLFGYPTASNTTKDIICTPTDIHTNIRPRPCLYVHVVGVTAAANCRGPVLTDENKMQYNTHLQNLSRGPLQLAAVSHITCTYRQRSTVIHSVVVPGMLVIPWSNCVDITFSKPIKTFNL